MARPADSDRPGLVLALKLLGDPLGSFEQDGIGRQEGHFLLLATVQVAHPDVLGGAIRLLADVVVGHHARADHNVAGQQIRAVGASAAVVEHGRWLVLRDDRLGDGTGTHHIDAAERQHDGVAVKLRDPGATVAAPLFAAWRQQRAEMG